MNTILITGKASVKADIVKYDVNIWASKEGEQIQFIKPLEIELKHYGDLWAISKQAVSKYFENTIFQDGAYTQYLDHIIVL